MSEALEAQLRANPDDEAAWLVYGDWLLEHGDPRGEFVRAPRALTDDEQARWRGAIPAKAVTKWRHGFVAEIELPYDVRTPAALARILDDPAARFVSSLRVVRSGYWDRQDYFPEHVDDQEAGDVLGGILALDLQRFRALAFTHWKLGPDGARRLAAARVGPLGKLDLRYTELGDDGVEALASLLPGVRVLRLQCNAITERGVRALVGAAQLELLDLRYNPIGEAGAHAIAHSPHVTRLARLLVYPQDLTPAGARVLAASANLPSSTRRYWSARA